MNSQIVFDVPLKIHSHMYDASVAVFLHQKYGKCALKKTLHYLDSEVKGQGYTLWSLPRCELHTLPSVSTVTLLGSIELRKYLKYNLYRTLDKCFEYKTQIQS